MPMDSLNSITKQQLSAMQGMLAGNDSSKMNDTDIAFQSIMKNVAEEVATNGNMDNTGITSEQLIAMSLMSNGQITNNEEDDNSNNLGNMMSLSNSMFIKSLQDKNKTGMNISKNEKINQECSEGSDLEKLNMDVNGYTQISGQENLNSQYVNNNVSPAKMNQIYDVVKQASKKYGVDEKLILAIIKQESNFSSTAVSSAGATGIMQIMPSNFKSVGITNPYDIKQNIYGGTKLIKDCLNRYNGDVQMALMAYNAGSGNMQRRGVTSSRDLYKMPNETQNYVPKVMNYFNNDFSK